jgi:hypothetical protein
MPAAIMPPRIGAHLVSVASHRSRSIMRGILLWVVGIPIPVIILLYLFHVI